MIYALVNVAGFLAGSQLPGAPVVGVTSTVSPVMQATEVCAAGMNRGGP